MTDERPVTDRRKADGASVTIHDPRVTGALDWVKTICGAIALAAILWIATSISGLKESVASIVTQNQNFQQTLQDHSERIKQLERNRDRP
jgi:hypothetical protein